MSSLVRTRADNMIQMLCGTQRLMEVKNKNRLVRLILTDSDGETKNDGKRSRKSTLERAFAKQNIYTLEVMLPSIPLTIDIAC